MKKYLIIFLSAGLITLSGCKKYLDVNENPNAPQEVTANLYLAPMLHWAVTAPQFDGRFVGRYTQNWYLPSTSISTWDRMGFDPNSDNGAQVWRDVYWSLGQNLSDMMVKAEAEQRWDLLGVGYFLKAWGWQATSGLHGEIIVKEALDQSKTSFNYDSQEYVYDEVKRLLNLSIENLQKTDGAVDAAFLGKTDIIYKGNRQQWLKAAYGLLATTLNHYSNKPSYNPDEVIAAVDKSFASNADDFLLAYTGNANDDTNFWGPRRSNLTNYRQTAFAVSLFNGTVFNGVVDPRMSRILAPAQDGEYRGLDINTVNYGALTTAQRPLNFWGAAGNVTLGTPSRYIFADKSKIPLMTYSQLQFIKAEAALRKGDRATALTAFRNGVSSHFDFVNARNLDEGQTPSQISAAEKTAYLNNPAVVPDAANLTLTHIMLQKYIAQYGWGHMEQWMDLRRFHYTDADPATGNQVFVGFQIPANLYPMNASKPAYRIRPRYNSEYVWNRAGLETIGGLADDYHTKEMWITQP
jgi:hypothetical protein